MTAPILALHDEPSKTKITANLLPCRVHHDGSAGELPEYWVVDSSQDGKPVTFFRGRKLHGKVVAVPHLHRGLIVRKGKASPPHMSEQEQRDNDDEKATAAPIQASAEFSDIIIWGHETVVESSTDPHLRSMDEWLEVSMKIHDFSNEIAQVAAGK